jgi:FkbM family methyltransferase
VGTLKRRLAEKAADLLGCHILPKVEGPIWPERDFVRRLFDRLKPDCVFDVGANVGQYGQSLRASGFQGSLISFEPNPVAFGKLQRVASSDPSWRCYPVALGAKAGTLPFHVMRTDVFSSFLNPAQDPNVEFRDHNVVDKTINVEVTTLDALFPKLQRDHGFKNPFLKMDTQGFDLEVVKGASGVIGAFCGLLSEISIRAIYDGAPDFHQSLATFNSAGFDLAGLYSVHPQLVLKLIEYNCYCVRHDIAQTETID